LIISVFRKPRFRFYPAIIFNSEFSQVVLFIILLLIGKNKDGRVSEPCHPNLINVLLNKKHFHRFFECAGLEFIDINACSKASCIKEYTV